jgi:hypothetical protein
MKLFYIFSKRKENGSEPPLWPNGNNNNSNNNNKNNKIKNKK